MKAAFLTGIRQVEVREAPEPQLAAARDVLVKIERVGVCGSDLHYYSTGRIGATRVDYPFVIGHECAGTVVESGGQAGELHVGQRVAIDPLVACGHCDQCCAGRRNTCRNQRFVGFPGQLSGALAEYLAVPAECCFTVPDSMTLTEAALVEPFSVALYAVRLAGLKSPARIGVLGSGPIGLCVLLAARVIANCAVYITDLVNERLSVASRCGASWTGNPSRHDVVRAIADQEPLGLDAVFECAGQQETLDQGVELLKPGGTLLLVGIPKVERINFNIDLLRRKELRVLNVRRQNECTGPAIAMIASGAVKVAPLVTHEFPLCETAKAFDLVAARRDGVVKAIIHVAP
jgi:L-iditol 2-dehydrogenase